MSNFWTSISRIAAIGFISAASLSVEAALTAIDILQRTHLCHRIVMSGSNAVSVATDNGNSVYHRLERIVKQDRQLIQELLNTKNPALTLGNALRQVSDDRNRIVKELKLILADVAKGSTPYYLLQNALHHLAEEMSCTACAQNYRRPFMDIMKTRQTNENDGKINRYFLEKWSRNRSFVDEVLTALEVTGLMGTSLTIEQIMPKRTRSLLVYKLRTLGKMNLLGIEIDVVARDPEDGGYLWIEVKSPIFRVLDSTQHTVDRIFDKKNKIEALLAIINSDPQLRNALDARIKFRVVFRGEGADQAVLNRLAQAGIVAYDHSRP